MTTETEVKRQWGRLLKGMLQEHREKYPADPRTDKELVVTWMDDFVRCGLIERHDGRYRIGPLT
jgi:hypothetical protein